MRPTISLDVATVRENARAWRAYAGVPLRAVIKSDGYGWGFETMIRALEDEVDGFVVADVEEFDAVRSLTRRSVSILSDAPVEDVRGLLEARALPNLASREGVEAAIAWARSRGVFARVRIGLSPAVGWAGFAFEELLALIPLLAAAELEIEFWTHIASPSEAAAHRLTFLAAATALREGGARVLTTDVESTAPLASGQAPTGAFVRLGIGLFGARCGGGPRGVRCALRAEAPIVRRLIAQGQRAGYGGLCVPSDGREILTVRCGYGDGFPRVTGTALGILAAGMQYMTLSGNGADAAGVSLLNADTDLDDLARAAGIAPHEIVVRLGNTARSRSPLVRKQS